MAVQTPDTEQLAAAQQSAAETALVSWVMGRVRTWREERDSNHKARWDEYYRLWRGIWAAEDKQRKSERSRLITPALQQAIESVTSEIESAILDKPEFFDVSDNRTDENPQDIGRLRDILREDLEWADYQQALNAIFLHGSLFGTGIGKIDVNEVDIATIEATVNGPEAVAESRTQVKLWPVLPSEFVIDTAAKSIEEALGCAHEYATPRHEVVRLQQDGAYRPNEIKAAVRTQDPIEDDEVKSPTADSANIVDYRGKVPKALLDATQPLEDGAEFVSLFPEDENGDTVSEVPYDEDDLVEALIVIGNEQTLLKAIENPLLLKDRLFVAYRHEIVPDQFWGRGVAEKGYNSQKALDASMRARIDGLALTVHPMMGIDGTRMPHGFKFSVSPGKSIVTNGDAEQILRPIRFGNIDPNVFTDNAELERMVTMSTGGVDTAAPVTVNGRNETAAGMSMQLGNVVKRAKRTIRNIEREMIVPLITKTHRAYMQFERDRYPAMDVTYRVTSVLGTMARELEQQQFSAMLNSVEAGTPAFWMLMKSIYSTSSLSNREQMLPLIEQSLQQSMQPPPPDPMVELKRQEIMGKLRAEGSRIQTEHIRALAEIARAANDARTAASEEAKNEADAILKLAKAEAEEIGSQYNTYKAWVEELERTSVAAQGLAEEVIDNVNATATNAGA